MILIYLGSGPTAHTIHRWISDMLEELTIDTRSESMRYVFAANSNSNLQMQKAGMKLMTPGQVSRMPKDDCILFLEGYRPIYDKKNCTSISGICMYDILHYAYEHLEECKLILCCSEGTKFAGLIDEMVEIEVEGPLPISILLWSIF